MNKMTNTYIIECYTNEDLYGFNFTSNTRDFKWDCKKVIDGKTKQIIKYECVFYNRKDFDSAIDMTEGNLAYQQMKWKYITNEPKKSRWNIDTLNELNEKKE